jgi:hypothetical protein
MSEELESKVFKAIKDAWHVVTIELKKPTFGDAMQFATEAVMRDVVDPIRSENERLRAMMQWQTTDYPTTGERFIFSNGKEWIVATWSNKHQCLYNETDDEFMGRKTLERFKWWKPIIAPQIEEK